MRRGGERLPLGARRSKVTASSWAMPLSPPGHPRHGRQPQRPSIGRAPRLCPRARPGRGSSTRSPAPSAGEEKRPVSRSWIVSVPCAAQGTQQTQGISPLCDRAFGRHQRPRELWTVRVDEQQNDQSGPQTVSKYPERAPAVVWPRTIRAPAMRSPRPRSVAATNLVRNSTALISASGKTPTD